MLVEIKSHPDPIVNSQDVPKAEWLLQLQQPLNASRYDLKWISAAYGTDLQHTGGNSYAGCSQANQKQKNYSLQVIHPVCKTELRKTPEEAAVGEDESSAIRTTEEYNFTSFTGKYNSPQTREFDFNNSFLSSQPGYATSSLCKPSCQLCACVIFL